MTVNQNKVIDILFQIEGFEDYGFGSDKNLYNLKTGRKLNFIMLKLLAEIN